ncbi:hypothetical protein ACQEU3_38900 [Spirillospora sp. CA-253888]
MDANNDEQPAVDTPVPLRRREPTEAERPRPAVGGGTEPGKAQDVPRRTAEVSA